MVLIDSKHGELKNFYELLSDFKNHKPITIKTISHKNRYLNTYKKKYDSEDLNKRDEKFFDPNQLKILGKEKPKSDSTEENTEREAQKLLWFKIIKAEFEELTGDIYNNQYNNDFKIIMNNKTYDLINAKKFWMEVTTRKITKREAKKLYNKLIQKEIDSLEREKNDDIRKYNTLDILNNVGSVFTGTHFQYKDVPTETMFERSISEITNLRKGRFDEIKRKEQNINNQLLKAYFTDYQSPSNMYKKLSKTRHSE